MTRAPPATGNGGTASVEDWARVPRGRGVIAPRTAKRRAIGSDLQGICKLRGRTATVVALLLVTALAHLPAVVGIEAGPRANASTKHYTC